VTASNHTVASHTSEARHKIGQRRPLNGVGSQHIRLLSCDAFRQAQDVNDCTVIWRKHDSGFRGRKRFSVRVRRRMAAKRARKSGVQAAQDNPVARIGNRDVFDRFRNSFAP
jgi:hypothetical protein